MLGCMRYLSLDSVLPAVDFSQIYTDVEKQAAGFYTAETILAAGCILTT